WAVGQSQASLVLDGGRPDRQDEDDKRNRKHHQTDDQLLHIVPPGADSDAGMLAHMRERESGVAAVHGHFRIHWREGMTRRILGALLLAIPLIVFIVAIGATAIEY